MTPDKLVGVKEILHQTFTLDGSRAVALALRNSMSGDENNEFSIRFQEAELGPDGEIQTDHNGADLRGDKRMADMIYAVAQDRFGSFPDVKTASEFITAFQIDLETALGAVDGGQGEETS
ncbi:MAG: hypothetical protein HQ488_00770 [Parcubacteria group bacterium]|nr:hypothetical protein [Parcubacteria group bacterium]